MTLSCYSPLSLHVRMMSKGCNKEEVMFRLMTFKERLQLSSSYNMSQKVIRGWNKKEKNETNTDFPLFVDKVKQFLSFKVPFKVD
jgi:hypothetical protein